MTADDPERPPDLPEYRDNPFINRLPPVLPIAEALRALTELPAFSDAERRYPAHLRAHCILRLGRYFDPLERHLVLENRVSALLRQGYVGRNPVTGDDLRALQNDYERVSWRDLQAGRHPVRSTDSGFALVGCSGVGKSKSIERILCLYPQVIHHAEPFSLDQVVWMRLDCPYIGSPKQLCISFFHEMDRLLGTRYQGRYGSSRLSIDEMGVHRAHVADLHALGALVIDEIQHLTQARGAGPDGLLNFLVTLVNTIGIPVILIGTLGALPLLQGAFRQARRASGLGSLVWERLDDGRLLHLEWQTGFDAAMPQRMLEYRVLIASQHAGKRIHQVVIQVGGDRPVADALETDALVFRYRVLDSRAQDPAPLLASPAIEDNLLAVLFGRPADLPARVRAILRRLATLDRRASRDALTRLLILAGLHHATGLVLEEAKAMPLQIDIERDPYLAQLVHKGRVEGRVEGEAAGEAKALIRLAERRFGPLPAALRDRVLAAEPGAVQSWLDRLIDAPDLETLFAEGRANRN